MGITVYSLLWVMQDFVHQPYEHLRVPSYTNRMQLFGESSHNMQRIDLCPMYFANVAKTALIPKLSGKLRALGFLARSCCLLHHNDLHVSL